MLTSPSNILKQYWGFDKFRGEQESVIHAVLQGKDVLALLPTGAGKSVCFQVPAMMKDGLCLVITPLIALMNDQVENLKKKNIPACAIHSGKSEDEVINEFENAANGLYKFLYISTERIETSAFQQYTEAINVSLIAVDEAHCISQWGYDFRPSYLQIVQLKKYFPDIPMLALTASATPVVQKDIIEKLLFSNYEIFRSSFQRDNISFQVKFCDNKIDALSKILSQENGSAIVYCKTRRLTQDVSKLLNIQNIHSDFYHAGLSQEDRNAKQENWMNGEASAIVCTNAFGMGIDKPDVRCVVHYDAPDCLENYYQEAGRAGRDGKFAKAILLYQNQDLKDLRELPEIRFPPFSEIKKVYQHLCDFLQIPVGLGAGNYYDFDLNIFAKNFRLNIIQTVYCIKALEQSGFISYTESIFLPSKIKFTTDKESLYEFENNYPDYEPVIKYLLRNYEGIFSYRASVNEKRIAFILHISESSVMQQLRALQQLRIIEYLPRKETPQIFFETNRAPSEFLLFNHEAYLNRKKLFVQRVEKILQYIGLKECRSVFIAKYFGDENTYDCNICDNCTASKKEKLSAKEFKEIASEIFILLQSNSSIDLSFLQNNLSQYSSEKIKEAIKYLHHEGRVRIDIVGKIYVS